MYVRLPRSMPTSRRVLPGEQGHVARCALIVYGAPMTTYDGPHATFPLAHLPVTVVTVSDRGSRGEYVDRSGPLLVSLLETGGFERVTSRLVPDGVDSVRDALTSALAEGARLVITMGIYYINRLIALGPQGRAAEPPESGTPVRPLSAVIDAAREIPSPQR